MAEPAEENICQFYRFIADAPVPRRADPAADGKIPLNAFRYCEPFRAASAFGWHIRPPMTFSLLLDDDELFWRYEGAEDDEWIAVQGGAQYPGFSEDFARMAPEELKDLAPPFLLQGSLPGQVQIWSGWIAHTAPGWALLSRGVVNAQNTQAYRPYDGIIETDSWFGPLIANLRLTRTNSPVYFHKKDPLFQVQPILRQCYRAPGFEAVGAEALTLEDWRRFAATIERSVNHTRHPGHYAVETRRRSRAEYPQ